MTLEEQYRLSCYQDLTELGGHHNVHLVKHNLTGEIYTKKILRRFSFDVYFQLQNAQISGIPQIHEMIPDGDSLILIEDYIHGQTLEQLLKQKGTLSHEEVFAILLPLCDTLGKLHRLNPPVVHRDLKLSNIIRTDSGSIYIVDFDTARNYEPGLEQDTELLGTKEYASPEQYGFGQSDARSDIYALGVIINRLLTGEYPKHQLCEGTMQPIVSRCTRMDPEARFQSVDELIAVVKTLFQRRRILDSANRQGTPTSETKVRRKPTRSEKRNQRKEKRSPYRLPGFRTDNFALNALAMMGYFFLFVLSMFTVTLDEQKSMALTIFLFLYERLALFGTLLSVVLYNFDYMNIRTKLFQGRDFPFPARLLLQAIVTVGIVVTGFFIMFCPEWYLT